MPPPQVRPRQPGIILAEDRLRARHECPDLAEWCDLIALGKTQRAAYAILRDAGRVDCGYDALYMRARRHPVWREILEEAHEATVQRWLDKLYVLAEEEDDPKRARLVTAQGNLLSWLLAKKDRNRFGDYKQTDSRTEVTVTPGQAPEAAKDIAAEVVDLLSPEERAELARKLLPSGDKPEGEG